jgi:glyoxylate reductase
LLSRPRIYVSRRVPELVYQALRESFELGYHDSERPPAREELLGAVAGTDGLITTLSDKVDRELLDSAGGKLKVLANYAVGFDNVDLEAARVRNVLVANTPDVLTRATAEFTLALMLSLLRRVTEGDRFLRRRESWIWAPTFMLGSGIEGRTLGVVGFGRIGKEVARLAAGLGMRVIYAGRRADPSSAHEYVPLERLLGEADVVSLHCLLTPETHHLIGKGELGSMRPSAVLINTTRGPVVDERALIDALREGEIAGAALDVYEDEPRIGEDLLEFENVVLAPHLASATQSTREAMGMLCVEALTGVLLEQRVPSNIVNPAAASSR